MAAVNETFQLAAQTQAGHKEPKLISWLKKHESKIIVVSEKSKNPATKRQ